MDNDWTKVLGFPGYRVYQHEIDEQRKQVTLWIRRKRGNQSLRCPGCGRPLDAWRGKGFLPRVPETLEELDLLLGDACEAGDRALRLPTRQ
jgi:hypothetical protein